MNSAAERTTGTEVYRKETHVGTVRVLQLADGSAHVTWANGDSLRYKDSETAIAVVDRTTAWLSKMWVRFE